MERQAGVTVFLIDDDRAVLKALTRLLTVAGYETRSFISPHDFLATYESSVAGCAIVDLSMADIDGLTFQDQLHSSGVELPLIFLTGAGDITSSVQAMKAGAIDFLTKPVNRSLLLAAIERALEADRTFRSLRAEAQSIDIRLAKLTPREREVLCHVVAGRLNKQIAVSLGTVEKTIKVHRGRMMQKMGVCCVADLVRLSDRAGIVPARPSS